MLTDFYPLNAPKLEGGPYEGSIFAFFFSRFILLAPAHTVSLQPLQPVLYYIDPSFSLSFCLDPHVFNVNATKNHDPFLLTWFSFTIFRSLSRPVFFFRVTGFRQIPSSFYWRWREIPHLNFLPLYHYDELSFSGRIWAYSHLGCRSRFLGVPYQYGCRQRLCCPQKGQEQEQESVPKWDVLHWRLSEPFCFGFSRFEVGF